MHSPIPLAGHRFQEIPRGRMIECRREDPKQRARSGWLAGWLVGSFARSLDRFSLTRTAAVELQAAAESAYDFARFHVHHRRTRSRRFAISLTRARARAHATGSPVR